MFQAKFSSQRRNSGLSALALEVAYARAGKDVIGLAQTGSGKTGAFAMPILQVRLVSSIERLAQRLCTGQDAQQIADIAGLNPKVCQNFYLLSFALWLFKLCVYHLAWSSCLSYRSQTSSLYQISNTNVVQELLEKPQPLFALVLSPTRELAIQIAEQFEALGSGIGVKCAVLVGGIDLMQQAMALGRRPHIIVGTPGRVVDHLSNTKARFLAKHTSSDFICLIISGIHDGVS